MSLRSAADLDLLREGAFGLHEDGDDNAAFLLADTALSEAIHQLRKRDAELVACRELIADYEAAIARSAIVRRPTLRVLSELPENVADLSVHRQRRAQTIPVGA